MRLPGRSLAALLIVLTLLAATTGAALPGPAPAPPTAAPLAAALAALDAHAARARSLEGLGESLEPLLATERANLVAADELLRALDLGPRDALQQAALAAERLTLHQARLLDATATAPAMPGHATPGAALEALLRSHGHEPTPQQILEAQRLDTTPEPVRGALLRTLNAFLAFDAATLDALQGNAPDAFDVTRLAPVLLARNALLAASLDLHTALTATGPLQQAAAIDLAPVAIIDLDAVSNTYPASRSVHLLIDAGGDDTYSNNAGGSDLSGTCTGTLRAAALLDLGGNDQRPTPRYCGATGGGYQGSGFLLDTTGNDYYGARAYGTNGGGAYGTGFLLDAEGHDVYNATDHATNGGGFTGVGLLVDGNGNDWYLGRGDGVNGGGAQSGLGTLIDLGGFDRLSASGRGANGGGTQLGLGYLFKTGGSASYTVGGDGGNGGGSAGGIGFLLGASGNDRYGAGSLGVNGGGYGQGVGLLVDTGGDDRYLGAWQGVNGGATYLAAGALIDLLGWDSYSATGEGANGGADSSVGLLLDVQGNDAYTVTHPGPVNGGGRAQSLLGAPAPTLARLIDLGGRDAYTENHVTTYDTTLDPKGQGGARYDYAMTTDL
ncbi:MAG TPA: hypothetical protein VNZ52_01830 [Candidatus Thermoplasmatota archaeon]|nr:hypothetical protein [Candidatus Thermoplasmatota archaeon]